MWLGQHIGIAVSMRTKPTLLTARHSVEHSLVDVSEDDLRKVFGDPGRIHVYTRTITYVGDMRIEYDTNTFAGCSGAVTFLLDKHQPPSVGEDYF